MPSVDNRVVEMRFDNKQFESGVGTSLKSLEKLKKSLKLEDAAKGFSTIDKAANNVDISGLNSAVQSVNDRFSSLGIIGNQVLRRIGDEVFNLERKMLGLVKSMSVDQITKGFGKYEEKTGSVQTIMNATGKSIGDINKYLDRLMWYSDETSFGFTDMTTALQTMTSSGGELDNLVPMLMGIGNAVAFAGKGASEFSRVMYNLNQSYSMGYLSTQDWKSVELMGASSKQLKEQLISVAEELGNIKKGAYGLEDFSELLTKKVFDKKVMEKAFGNFADMTLKAEELVKNGTFDTASEAYDYLASKYDTVSLKAAKAAQEAKTFSEAIDATKDAVSSGWMKTFELLIGDYQEAKTLWTKLANDLWDMFASGAESRNAILTTWHNFGYGMTGYEALMESLSNIWEGFSNIVYTVKDALSEVIPPITSKRLTDLTFKFKELTENFKKSFHIAEDLQTVVREVMAPFNKVVQKTEELSEETDKNTENVEKLTKSNEKLKESSEEASEAYSFSAEKYREALQEVKERTTTSENILTIKKIVEGIGSGLSLIAQAGSAVWNQVIKPAGRVAGELLSPLVDILAWISEKLTEINKKFKKTGAFEKFLKPIGNVLRWIGDRLQALNKKLKETNFFGRNLEKIVGIFRRFKERLKEIWEQAKNLQSVKDLIDRFTKFKESLEGGKFGFIDKINGFFDNLDNVDIPLPTMERCLEIIDTIAKGINDFIGYIEEGWPKVKEFFDSFNFSNVEEGASTAGDKVKSFIKNIFEDNGVIDSSTTFFSNVFAGLEKALSKIDWGKTLLLAFSGLTSVGLLEILFGTGKAANGLGEALARFAEIPKGIVKLIASTTSVLKATAHDLNATALLKIAAAIALLAASMIALTFVDQAKLQHVAADMFGIIAALAGLAWAISKFKSGSKFENTMGLFANTGKISVIPKSAAILTSLGIALLGLAGALWVMSKIPANDLERIMRTVLNAVEELIGVLVLVGVASGQYQFFGGSSLTKDMPKIAKAILLIGAAMLILAGAAKIISTIPSESLTDVMVWIAVLIGVMGVVVSTSAVISKIGGNIGVLIKLGVAFILLATALTILSVPLLLIGRYGGNIMESAMALGILAVALSTAAFVAGSIDKSNIANILVLAAAMGVMAIALAELSKIKSTKTMWKGFGAMAASLGLLLVAGLAIKVLGLSGVLQGIALALAGVGAAIMFVGVGALSFAKAMQLLSDSSVNAKAAGANLAEGIVAFFDVIMEKGGSILKFVGLLITAVIAVILAHKVKMALAGVDVLKALASRLPSVLPEVLAAVAILLGMLLEWLGINVGPLAESLLLLVLKLIYSLARLLIANAHAIFMAIKVVIVTLGVLILQAIIDFIIGPIAGLIDVFGKTLGQDWGLENKLYGWFENNVTQPLISDIDEQNAIIGSKLSETASTIKSGGDEVSEAATSAARDISGASDTLSESLSTLHGAGRGGSNDFYGPMPFVVEDIEEINRMHRGWKARADEYTAGAQEIDRTSGEFIDATNRANQGIKDAFTAEENGAVIYFEELPNIVETSYSDATAAVNTYGGEFNGSILDSLKLEGAGDVSLDGIMEYARGFTDNKDIPADAARDVAQKATDAMAEQAGINSPSTVTTEQGKNIDIGLAQGMSNNVTFVTVASRRVMNAAVDALKPLYGKFRQAGKDSVTGLVNGLSDYMYKVSEKARVMGNTLLTVFGRTIGWGSPAKEFIKAGRDVNRGLAIGFDNYQYFSTNAAKRLGNATIDKIRSILKDLATVIDQDVDVNPRITPVLDLSELQNGGNRISSLLSGRGIGYAPNLAYARAAGAAINVGSADIHTGSDSGVINAIREIRNDISELNDSITKMKLYIDKGVLVGSMLPDIDSGLNTRIGYKRRGL